MSTDAETKAAEEKQKQQLKDGQIAALSASITTKENRKAELEALKTKIKNISALNQHKIEEEGGIRANPGDGSPSYMGGQKFADLYEMELDFVTKMYNDIESNKDKAIAELDKRIAACESEIATSRSQMIAVMFS